MSTNSSSDCVVDVWSGLQHSVVDAAVSEWRSVCRRVFARRTSAAGCFDNGMKLSIDSLCTMSFGSF